MFMVMFFDGVDDVMVFEGTLSECLEVAAGDAEYFVVAPDGFTVM